MNEALDLQDILLMPIAASTIVSRREPTLGKDIVPVSAANMEGVGTFSIAVVLAKHKWCTYIHKGYSIQEWEKFLDDNEASILRYVVPTIGSSEAELDLLDTILEYYIPQRICIDVANGHSIANMEQIGRVRERFPQIPIIYGNVANPDVLDYMADNNLLPEWIKIGIGSGSVCTTRLKTGVGVPQATLIKMFYDKILYGPDRNIGEVRIISDGGCRTPGDVVKAMALGADEVMLGGMLAYTEEAESDSELVQFRGSSHKNSPLNNSNKTYATSEGLDTYRQCVGPVENIVQDIEGGMRSALAYLGVNDIYGIHAWVKGNQILVARRQTSNYE